jgi:hypothetical protein
MSNGTLSLILQSAAGTQSTVRTTEALALVRPNSIQNDSA